MEDKRRLQHNKYVHWIKNQRRVQTKDIKFKNLKESKLGLCITLFNKAQMIKIGKNISNLSTYSYRPTSRDELKKIINERISKEGFKCDLNDIDTSLITDMTGLFYDSDFNGNISKWNTSNVKSMTWMFYCSKFDGDISDWDVSKVEDMSYMFAFSEFNQDISRWDVSSVTNMISMLKLSDFNQDISKWNVSNVATTFYMFDRCKINKEYKPKSLQV